MISMRSLKDLLAPRKAGLPGAAPGQPTGVPSSPPPAAAPLDRDLAAPVHPLHRRFLAYREGQVDGCRHSVDEAAEHFGIDPALARLTDRYLQARRRLVLGRAGWRAGRFYTR
jgi:hypothetical protein